MTNKLNTVGEMWDILKNGKLKYSGNDIYFQAPSGREYFATIDPNEFGLNSALNKILLEEHDTLHRIPPANG